MKYNEWRDELKDNLLCVSEAERRRVLDYYAEAYADRREAGFSEREIIDDFGAPYDAAQKILQRSDDDFTEQPKKREDEEAYAKPKKRQVEEDYFEQPKSKEETPVPAPPKQKPERAPAIKKSDNLTWVFVLLCIIFCVPLFLLVLGMVIVTVWLCVFPFALMIAGVVQFGAGIGTLVSGGVHAGLFNMGLGLIAFGLSIILIPLFIKLVKLMWKAFKMFFAWLKRLFSGKEVCA